jgi:hypothetical protein
MKISTRFCGVRLHSDALRLACSSLPPPPLPPISRMVLYSVSLYCTFVTFFSLLSIKKSYCMIVRCKASNPVSILLSLHVWYPLEGMSHKSVGLACRLTGLRYKNKAYGCYCWARHSCTSRQWHVSLSSCWSHKELQYFSKYCRRSVPDLLDKNRE